MKTENGTHNDTDARLQFFVDYFGAMKVFCIYVFWKLLIHITLALQFENLRCHLHYFSFKKVIKTFFKFTLKIFISLISYLIVILYSYKYIHSIIN